MTEQAAAVSTPAAAPSPAAPPPAVVSTPRPAGNPTPARPKPPQIQKTGTNTVTKSYDVGGRAKQAAAPAPAAPAAPALEVGSPVGSAPLVGAGAVVETAPVVDAAALDVPAEVVTETPVAVEAPKVDDLEMAKRLGRIDRAEKKLSEERRQFATEREKHAVALQRIEVFEKAAAIARQDPVGFMARQFGITQDQLVTHLVNGANRKPEQVQAETQSAAEARIAALETQLQKNAQETQAQREAAQVRDYISGTVAPVVSDSTKYPLLHAEFGAEVASQVYRVIKANYDKTGRAPSPQETADFVEKHLRDGAIARAKLLGLGAPVQQAASPAKVVPPPAKTPGTAQATPAGLSRRTRNPGKPYTTTVK